MQKKSGPWELNEVKSRLRREQVARETAATQRYRQLEARDQQGNRGETSQSNCVLLVLVVVCLVLALCLLLLSGAVLSLSKK
jgi:hypothetical protein